MKKHITKKVYDCNEEICGLCIFTSNRLIIRKEDIKSRMKSELQAYATLLSLKYEKELNIKD